MINQEATTDNIAVLCITMQDKDIVTHVLKTVAQPACHIAAHATKPD
jgi:hypothetical protein